MAGQAHGLAGQVVGDAGELEHHATGLDDGDPALGRALAGAHAGLGRLLGERLVGIDVDPDLAAALDLARHGDTSGLDLAVGQPAGVERLQAELAELDLRLPARQPGLAPTVLLAVLDALRGEHLPAASLVAAAATAAAATATAAAEATATAAATTAAATATRTAPAATA